MIENEYQTNKIDANSHLLDFKYEKIHSVLDFNEEQMNYLKTQNVSQKDVYSVAGIVKDPIC